MSDHFDEFSAHGDDNGDVWLRHEPCLGDLDNLDDPWALDQLITSARVHLGGCFAGTDPYPTGGVRPGGTTEGGHASSHVLKTWPDYFQAILDETKTFELRRDDRPYAAGDRLILQEYDPDVRSYTGASAGRTVAYVLRGPEAEQFGLKPGYCVLGLARESPCPSCDATIEEAPEGDPGMEAVLAWFRNGGC